jgi:hypothetical protein
MEVLHPHCAGLDIQKDSVVACVRHMVDGKVTSPVKTFKTTTQELMALSDWLSAEGVTHVGIAYASHCTSLGRCETFSSNCSLFDNLTPRAFCGGLAPGFS